MAPISTTVFATSLLLSPFAHASQPGAARPVAAPMRDLVWGQVNFIHTTDTHGWHAGHLQESQYSADWGDYVSFASHMRKRADDEGRDVLLVDTGDRVEGNGLFDASEPKGQYYYDIYRQQHVDLVCAGNHELYVPGVARGEWERTVPNFGDAYIASNLDYVDPDTGERKPLAKRYRKFQTKNQKLNVVAFGFLFDFDRNANNTIVQPVKEALQEQWFQDAIREKPVDLFVVTGHVALRQQEFHDIFAAIRKQNWFTPIVFLGGHAHVRDALRFDDRSLAIASGRYFETIGWMSVDGIKKTEQQTSGNEEEEQESLLVQANEEDQGKQQVPPSLAAAPSFSRRYIDNNLLGLYHHSGLNASTFPTEQGRNVSAMIRHARAALALDQAFGCAPQNYWQTRVPYPHEESIYSWIQDKVLPSVTDDNEGERKDVPRLVLTNTGALRFDIFKGAFTIDTTYILSPFVSGFQYIPDVPFEVAQKVITLLNAGGKIFSRHLAAADGFKDASRKDLKFMNIPQMWDDHWMALQKQRHEQAGFGFLADTDADAKPDLVAGYTTTDDIGDDGDDAVHIPLGSFKPPNAVQAEVGFDVTDSEKRPEKVDVVFCDFIQPWILSALRFGGGDYGAKDVLVYTNRTLTELMAAWVGDNWGLDCVGEQQ